MIDPSNRSHRPGSACSVRRRTFLSGSAGLVAAAGLSFPARASFTSRYPSSDERPGLPGRFPGRVVEVHRGDSVRDGVPNADAVRSMVARGIAELTGIEEPVEAWRSMFERGDVVGIKVNPVGQPHAISNFATVHALVDGLESAGVRRSDIIIFDRYKDQFQQAGYERNLPQGCRWDWAVESYDEAQLEIARYDPDEFVQLDIVHARPGVHDPRDDRTRRSHLAKVLTRTINKLISIPVLKDHGSGGVTLALKNMSHGLVNNVSRSHGTSDTNTCNLFIPAVCAHPVIRQKAVLQVLDGLNAVYHRGPGAIKTYVWSYGSLFFATDPVAMDHVGWKIVDAQRVRENLPPVARAGKAGLDPTGTEAFDFRQPQHIPGAAALGLGRFEEEAIVHRRISLPS